ncbi:MAG: hypothetical protein U0Y10_21845 [Spirosomataceae bacterium]
MLNRQPLTAYQVLLSVFCFIATIATVQAQGIGNSPYTALGIGEQNSGAFAPNLSMGGAGVASANGIYINNLNPALLAWNRFTTFEVGMIGQSKTITESSKTQQTFGANLHYIALSFPVATRWTMSLKLMPYSYVDYEVRSIRAIPNTPNFAKYTNTGKGGLNKASITNGFMIGKSLFLGAEVGFLFGGIDRESDSQTLLNDGQDYRLVLLDRTNYSGGFFKGGFAYRQKLHDKLFLNIGGTADLQTNVGAERLQTFEAYVGEKTVGVIGADTIRNFANSHITLPASYRFGIGLEKPNKLQVSLDYTIRNWTKYRNFSNQAEYSQNGFTTNLGLAYTPNFLATTGFFKKTEYRFGLNYTRTPYTTPDGKPIDDYHATFGFGLPLRDLSFINLGFAVGQRNGTIKENYWRFTLGFTLNDRWFVRYRLE